VIHKPISANQYLFIFHIVRLLSVSKNGIRSLLGSDLLSHGII